MTAAIPAARQASYREVLAEPRFRLLFTTRSLAILADTLRTMALSVLIFAATRSALLAAITYGVAFFPQAVGGTLLGVLADRLSPRALIAAGYALEAAVAVVLAMAGLPVLASLALVGIVACLTPVFGGASGRLIASVLTGDAYVLGRSLTNISTSSAQVLGLAAGGAAVATLGARHALLITAGCHLVAAVAIWFRLPDLPAGGTPSGDGTPHRAAESRAGAPAPGRGRWAVLRQSLAASRLLVADPEVRVLLLATWLPPAFVVGAESLVVPYAAERGFPAGSPGLLLACLPAGMIAGDLVVGRLLRPPTRERLTAPLMASAGLPLLAFALAPGAAMAGVLLAVCGSSFAYNLGLQRRFVAAVPGPSLGQAIGLLSAGLMTSQGTGPAVTGVLAQLLSPGPAMALAGLASVISALALRSALRTPGDRHPAPPQPG